MIVNGPPGVGCSVISSVSGADYVIVVTEPTPIVLHDLERERPSRCDALWHPMGAIINKADISQRYLVKTMELAKGNGATILGRIPLDDAVPKSIAYRTPLVDFAPDSPAAGVLTVVFGRLSRILAGEAAGDM